MSTDFSPTELQLTHPRTIITSGLQLFYTIIAMIPFYYYLREIIQLNADAQYVLTFLPIATAIILFLFEIRLNEYYFFNEKVYKKRDIFDAAIKSTFVMITSFYVLFFFIFAYFLSNFVKEYQTLGLQNVLGKILFELSITIVILYLLVILMLDIQKERIKRISKYK